MTEIQELIANLQSKVKKQTDELSRIEQDAGCLKSLISNDRHALQKIVDSMVTIESEIHESN